MLFLLAAVAGCVWQDVDGGPTPTQGLSAGPTDTPVPLPDLAIEEVSLEVEIPPDGLCSPGDEIYFLSVTVVNRGSGSAGAFDVRVNDATQSAPDGLMAGEQITLSFSDGQTYAEALVDSSSQVVEANESNNLFTGNLTLPGLPAACRVTPTPEVILQPPLYTLEGHSERVLATAFSPDGRLVASGSVDNSMRLWTTDQGEPLRQMQGHNFPILCLQFTPDGSRLVTGSMDGILRVWQVSNSGLLSTMRGHSGWVTALDVSRNGQLLASGSDDFTVRIWRLASNSLLQMIDEGMAAINAITFSPDNRSVAWAEADGTVRLRSLSGEWLHTLKGVASPATGVVFSPDGDWLAASYESGAIYIWQVNDGTLRQVLATHTEGVNALAVSPDGDWLAAAANDGRILLWQANEAGFPDTPTRVYWGHNGRVNDVDFSPRGDLMVSAGEDRTVRLWQTPQNAP